ncbi:MAG TPA: glycosyltransferase [Rhodopila sp.]
MPRPWVPVALRGLTGMAAQLPPGMRSRVNRFLGLINPDMGNIERDYPAWIRLYDRVDDDTRRGIVAEIVRMPDPPLISVLMPVFNPPPEHLLAAIHSVRDQLYPWWELCISDDASTDPAVVAVLREAATQDHRIKLLRRERNGHISAASNSALRLATGAFVALLDHDDILPPHALHEVAARIVDQPNVDIIYSDEDHIDDEGRRSHPYFKPDWNMELILGQNLISHLGVYRRALIEQIGGFRTGFEGSQDYDLALRMVAETRADRIAHIPKVLYHWRQGAADRTFSEAARDRCIQNGRQAISEFIARMQPDAKVQPATLVPGWTRVVYPVPSPAPLVSVIISCDGPGFSVPECIDRLLHRAGYPELELLIISGEANTPALPGTPATDPRVRRISDHDATGMTAAAAARGSLLLWLDPRLEPTDETWLSELVSQAVRPGVGAVGAKLLGPDGTICNAGIAVAGRDVAFTPFVGCQRARTGYFGHLQLARDVTAVSGQCLMLRREAFLAAGGFDEVLALTAFSDVDLCLKLAEMGQRIVWTPYAELRHRDAAPRQRAGSVRSTRTAAARMRQRWGQKLDSDPYWNPNLSLDRFEIALAFPPRTGASRSRPRPSPKPAGQTERMTVEEPVSKTWIGDEKRQAS